jgi:hypothetical protein
VIAYKFLRSDGRGVFTRFSWPLPAGGPGAWVDAPVVPCRSGIHACRVGDLPLWLGRELYVVELAGEIVEEQTKVVASRARLVQRVDAWDDRLRAEYTQDCADRAREIARAADPPLAAWEAVVAPSIAEGPALLGFIAARIAEERGGVAAYHAERARQQAWLAERLGLEPTRPRAD